MSGLFRKEALSRRSRALFGEIILRSPLSNLVTFALIAVVCILAGWIIFGLSINGQSLPEWFFRER